MRLTRSGLLAGAAIAGAVALAVPAGAVTGGPPSVTPASWTPSIATSGTDGSVEKVRQLVPCGSMMYAVGTFSSIKQNGQVYTRHNAFSFNASTGAMSSWNPNVTGSVVNSIALSPDCTKAYLGGQFSSIGGTAAKNIAAVSTSTGKVVTGFARNASSTVSTVVVVNNHVIAGGQYTSINGSTRRYLASLNPTTGAADGYVNLAISGTYQYTDLGGRTSASNGTRVYNSALSPDRTRLLVMGVFTSVGGQHRQQIFMLDLGSTSTTVDAWYSSEFNENCAVTVPYWLRDASWSPDGTRVYIATTGYKSATGPSYYTTNPRSGLCDVLAAFPSTSSSTVTHLWTNYPGCDSLYATAADASTVYAGGHERWANNSLGCDKAGAGAIPAPGMGGFSPSTGNLTYNPTRDRGQGADDMLVTSAGLWVASDNAFGSNACGKTSTGSPSKGHAGICFLPY